ncbi:retropepsin-like aspartic protease family protein [Comamonas composti]|uniref:retropepsin-like aspartic protease family protein n=1 Tax=Comamonas composti TaxID=408558 RepID=UPI000400AD44|nr:retropepsin-like aspartic protease [Comamonas composti]
MLAFRSLLLGVLSAVIMAQAMAQSVSLGGIMGSKALLVINGAAPRAVSVNESLQGVRVLKVGPDSAEIEAGGQRQTLYLGQAPMSIGRMSAGTPLARRLVLKADGRGHFVEQGRINGKAMTYIVDTGASAITIGRSDAERMGLSYQQGRSIVMRTANGETQGWHMRLASVRIGDLEVSDVDAVIAPQSIPYVLLGNSFLAHFQMTRKGDEMVLEQR